MTPPTHEPVRFDFDAEKAVAVIAYLASRVEEVTSFDKYKAGKLIFLADKYHLVRYGRPILGDEYRALEFGPVPQGAMDMLHALIDPERQYTGAGLEHPRRAVEVDTSFRYPKLRARGQADTEALSSSEMKALRHIVKLHGRKSFEELKALTHETVAYKKALASRSPGAGMVTMSYEDFFDEDGDAIEGAFEEMIENDALRKAFPRPPGI